MTYDKNSIQVSWLEGDIDNTVISWAEDFGGFLADQRNGKRNTELTTSQLRKFFGEVKKQQIKKYNPVDFSLLKPKLAYAVGRTKSKDSKIKEFYEVIAGAIEKVDSEKKFKNFIKIFEAIVAYHKANEKS